MANDGLVEHSVSISSREVVGSQGSSGSSLVSSTNFRSETDGGLNASICNKSSVDIVTSRASLFDIGVEGAPPNGVEQSSTCMLVERSSISSDELVDREVEGRNESHTRSNVDSQCTEESAAQTARSTSDGKSKAAPATEDKATIGELATNIGSAEEGGSKAAPNTEDKATLGELATDIGNVKEGGSKAASTTEDKATLGELAINMCRVRGGGFKAVTSSEMIQSNGGGNIA
eukprot:10593381-Ditylum_brightwellii.AAC.1